MQKTDFTQKWFVSVQNAKEPSGFSLDGLKMLLGWKSFIPGVDDLLFFLFYNLTLTYKK